MWPIILGLIALGAVLLVVETFIPGMIVGGCGVLALIAAVVLGYMHHGVAAGSWLLVAVLLFGAVFFAWWLRYVPRSWFARRWTLTTAVEGKAAETPAFIDAAGTALTPLRPAGAALIDGRRVDVVAESDLIPAGAAVRVVRVEGARVVVRRTETSASQILPPQPSAEATLRAPL